MRLNTGILLLLSLCFLVSCGKDNDSSSSSSSSDRSSNGTQAETIANDGSNIQGIYAATLTPLNNNIHFTQVGTAAIQREGDALTATVKLKYGQRITTIRQSIYTGTRCPTTQDDINKDAYIDINEALPVIGKMLIPLDGNLDSQLAGQGVYPAGDSNLGGYFYKVTASFSRMFADLKEPDSNPYDNMTKLQLDEGLELRGKIIILQGLNERVFLPPTAATTADDSRYKSMPIACGVLKKVSKLPAELN